MDKPQQNMAVRLDCQVASIELNIEEVNGLCNYVTKSVTTCCRFTI